MSIGVSTSVLRCDAAPQGTDVRPLASPFCDPIWTSSAWLDALPSDAPWDSLDQAEAVARVEHALSLRVDDAEAIAWRRADDVRQWWAARGGAPSAQGTGTCGQEAQS